jgi:prepilin-type N-terminal cleavage/methylation domain-containing protein
MRLWSDRRVPRQGVESGFSLIEVLMGMFVVGGLIVSLYAATAWGFSVIRIARENLRATQVMAEKMETIRLYNWDQITSNGFIPPAFSVPYYPAGSSNSVGIIYQGTMVLTNCPLLTSYSNDMRKVIVTINWKSGNLPRTRSMESYVSRYGLQNYIY